MPISKAAKVGNFAVLIACAAALLGFAIRDAGAQNSNWGNSSSSMGNVVDCNARADANDGNSRCKGKRLPPPDTSGGDNRPQPGTRRLHKDYCYDSNGRYNGCRSPGSR